MSSINDDDPTLPVDFDASSISIVCTFYGGSGDDAYVVASEIKVIVYMAAPKGFLYYKYKQTNNCSTNLDQLTEVTVGPHLEFPDGSVPMVTKAGSGRMSPVRSRTMKEYDQQLAELKKENFSLKLRIYFLEERMQQKFSGNGEEVFKTNIELKVGVESLKKELQDKQELLRKASSALETISTQHQVELQQAQDQTTGGAQAKECKKRVEELEKLLLQNTEDLQKSHRQLEEANQKLQEVVTANRQLDTAYKQLEATKWQLEEQLEGCGDSNASKNGNASDIEGKEMIITQLKSVIKTKELIIEQLEEEKKEVVAAVTRPLDEQTRHLEAELVNKEHEIQMLKKTGVGNKGDDDAPVTETAMHGMLNDYKHKVALLQEATDKLTSDLAEKDTFISRLEELVQDRDHNNGELVAVNRDHEENALKRDLAIQGLAKVVRQKEKEVQMLSAKLRERRLTDPTVGQQAETADFYGRDGAGSSGMNEEQLGSIEQELREKEMENKRLEEIIASKDAEIAALSRHTSQPSIAEVTQLNGTAGSDHLMAPLSPTSRDRSGNDVIDSVQGWRQRLADKEGEVARLTEKLRKSDAQLRQREDALEALLDDAHRQIHNQEKMLQHISHSLREKDKLLQEYMRLVDDQEPLNETQERVISNLRAALHEKDNVIEETMEDKCQTAATKDTEIRQLRTALRERDSDFERANQMLLSTEEMIDTLEVESRERKQNLDQMTASLSACQRVQQSMEESHSEAMEEKEALIGKLRDSLVRKEEELQELVQQGPDATDTLMQQLQHRLQEKENLLQEVMSDRSRVADLNKDALDKLLSKIAERELEVKYAGLVLLGMLALSP
ncbi:hypothetical protein LSAT2_019584 [Lamellibrachia satsuma]|nr:hypothetical protein LSAT2_019584 [Lamellibrachia satsuma]